MSRNLKSRKAVDPSLLTNLRKINRGSVIEVISFADAHALFLDNCKLRGLSEWTFAYYDKELKQINRELNDIDVDLSDIRKINKDDMERFIAHLNTKGFTLKTVNSRIVSAKTFFNFCRRKKFIAENPMNEINKMREKRKVGATFTKSQLRRLADTPNITTFAGLRDLAIMTTFEHTGIRVSELCGLSVSDIRFDDRDIIANRTKNGHGRRIPMTERLYDVLKAYMSVRGFVEGVDAVFVTSQDRAMPVVSVQYQLRMHGDKCGVRDEIQVSPHVYRRTFAKMKIQAGVNIFVLRDLMGHADIKELENYVRIYSPDLDAAIEKGVD